MQVVSNQHPFPLAGQTLEGGDDPDSLAGGDGDDIIRGLAGDDTLAGGGGDDTLDGGSGADRLVGGEGVDLVTYEAANGAVTVDLAAGQHQGWTQGDVFLEVERFRLSGFNDHFVAGVDAAHVHGGLGRDTLAGGLKADTLFGGTGDDQLAGSAGRDVLVGGFGADVLKGGQGYDIASYADAQFGVGIHLNGGGHTGDAAGDSFLQMEQFDLGAFADTFMAGAAAVVVRGMAGDDHLIGRDGDDILSGGEGADTLVGGAGVDTASYRDAASGVSIDRLTGAHGGEATGDRIAADIEIYVLSAFADQYLGSFAATVRGGSGADSLTGGRFADAFMGEKGADLLAGGAGADSLDGGAGGDTLDGGFGADTLRGGTGADVFWFADPAESRPAARDLVADFNAAEGDLMDLSAMDADTGADGDQAFVFVAAFSGAAGEAVLDYDAGADQTTLRLDVDGDGGADFALSLSGEATSDSGWVL